MKDETLSPGVRRTFILHPSAFILALALSALPAAAQSVRITDKPATLVHGDLFVPIVATPPVTKLVLFINGVKYSEALGTKATIQVHVGEYIRRLRVRAVGYDAAGAIAAEDEMVVNDPRPPFRVRLQAPASLPGSGVAVLTANVTHPDETRIAGVDFYVGEEKVATSTAMPYATSFDAARFPHAVYARVVARAEGGEEANDVSFFGDLPKDAIDVTLQHIPLSVASGPPPAIGPLT